MAKLIKRFNTEDVRFCVMRHYQLDKGFPRPSPVKIISINQSINQSGLLHRGINRKFLYTTINYKVGGQRSVDAIHHLGLLLHCQGVLYFGQHGAEGLTRPEDNLYAKLPTDPSDILTDPFYVGEHHQWGSVLFFQ